MRASDTSDQLGQDNCLTETSTTEQTGFSTAYEGGQQVNNFDTRFENFRVG